jgi:hypothetical protein
VRIFILEDNIERMRKFNRNLIGHIVFHSDNVENAKKVLSQETIDIIFLDHDLDNKTYVNSNEPNTGYQLAKWIVSNNIKYSKIIVHSMNTVGQQNIRSIIPNAECIPFYQLFKE